MENLPLKLAVNDIDPENPWADDKLGREAIAKTLSNYVEGQRESLVIGLHGSWGSGKTFLLQRWRQQLQNDGVRAVYFNAWEDDDCGDPLLGIIGQLVESLPDSRFERLKEVLANCAKVIVKRQFLKRAREFSLGIVDLGEDDFETISGRLLSEYVDEKAARKALSSQLSEIANQVAEGSNSMPLVFIIDELDRCRPTFAVELLERVKHLFSVPNMVFVIGFDRDQLESSIESVYGDIDANDYLKKFVDIQFTIPLPDTKSYCEFLLEQHGLEEFFRTQLKGTRLGDYNQFRAVFPVICRGSRLSLRDVEHVVRMFVVVGRNMIGGRALCPEILLVLLVLRAKNRMLYDSYITRRCPAREILDFVEMYLDPKALDYDATRNLESLESEVYASAGSLPDRSAIAHQLSELAEDTTGQRFSLLSDFTHKLSKKNVTEMSFRYATRVKAEFGTPPSQMDKHLLYLHSIIDLTG